MVNYRTQPCFYCDCILVCERYHERKGIPEPKPNSPECLAFKHKVKEARAKKLKA